MQRNTSCFKIKVYMIKIYSTVKNIFMYIGLPIFSFGIPCFVKGGNLLQFLESQPLNLVKRKCHKFLISKFVSKIYIYIYIYIYIF